MLCGCMGNSRVDSSGQGSFELTEQFVPALLMTVTRGLVEELLMMQRQQRAGAVRLQRNRQQRLALRRRMPGPAHHQQLVRDNIAIDAADLEMLAVDAGEADPIAAANARIGLRLQRSFLHLRRRSK